MLFVDDRKKKKSSKMFSVVLKLVIVVAALQLTEPIKAAKILGYIPSRGRSHFLIHDSLLRGLAAKGHEVFVI